MRKFEPFHRNEQFLIKSFIQVPRELMESENYKTLNPDAILLFSLLADRLALSFRQSEKSSKVKFYDDVGDMYVILKREEAEKKLHIKRAKLDKAIKLLKDCNLIKEKSQYNGLPNIIYVGKTELMKENGKIINLQSVENRQPRAQKFSTPECRKSAPYNNYNKINKNKELYCAEKKKFEIYKERTYSDKDFEKLYCNAQ